MKPENIKDEAYKTDLESLLKLMFNFDKKAGRNLASLVKISQVLAEHTNLIHEEVNILDSKLKKVLKVQYFLLGVVSGVLVGVPAFILVKYLISLPDGKLGNIINISSLLFSVIAFYLGSKYSGRRNKIRDKKVKP